MLRPWLRLALLAGFALLTAGACSSEDGAPAASSGCVHPSECSSPLTCLFQRCTPACLVDRDCQNGLRCLATKETTGCTSAADATCTDTCPDGTRCAMGTCRTTCGAAGDLPCLMGQACLGAVCVGGDPMHDPGAVGGAAGAAGDPGMGGGGTTGGSGGGVGGHGAMGGGAGGLAGGGGTGGAGGKAGSSAAGAGGAQTGGMAGAGGGGASGSGGAGGNPAGGASGGSSGAAGASGAGGSAVEDCLNGQDDDGDKLIDCADPDCSKVTTCASPVPIGFTGPVAYWTGASGSEPSCPGAYGVELLTATADVTCADPMCTCKCNAPTGRTCPGGVSVFWNNTATCPNGNGASQSGSCQAPDVSGPKHGTVFSFQAPTGGSCTGSLKSKTVPPATWATSGRICSGAVLQGGCVSGAFCAPDVPADFALCAYRDGDVDCPKTDYTAKHVIYKDLTDDRACKCDCQDPSGGGCGSSVDTFTGPGCTGTKTSFTGTCAPVSNVVSFQGSGSYDGTGTCTPKPSTTGGCTPATPVTVCCAP